MMQAPFVRRSFGSQPFLAGLLLFLALAIVIASAARAGSGRRERSDDSKPVVCAQVVFAIDGSESTGHDAFRRQLTALEAAFGSALLHRAIERCMPGSMAVAAITWSGPAQQEACIDWTVVIGPGDGLRAAEALGSCRYIGGTTDIGRAIGFALGLLADSPFESHYRVILLLTNGRTDRGGEADLLAARAEAVRAGVTIDGYALLAPESVNPSPFFVPDAVPLWKYVGKEVVAGPRSFGAHSRPQDDREGLLRALVEILRQEVF